MSGYIKKYLESRPPLKSSVVNQFQRLHSTYKHDSDDFVSLNLLAKVLQSRSEHYYVWLQENDPNHEDPEKRIWAFVFGKIQSICKALVYGREIVGTDATHNVNQYGIPLFMFTGRDNHGHGYPLIYALTSDTSFIGQRLIFRQMKLGITRVLQNHQLLSPTEFWKPRAMVIDKDPASRKVLFLLGVRDFN